MWKGLFGRREQARTYYEVLEVRSDATADQVKKSYYRVAKRWHPDLHQGDEEVADKFKEIQKAYEVLGNPMSREAYDIENRLNAHAGSSIYAAARFGRNRMAYRLKKQNEPYFSKYTGFRKPRWYSPFSGKDVRAEYRAFASQGTDSPRIVQLLRWLNRYRLPLYLTGFALVQLALLGGRGEESLKLALATQDKRDQEALAGEGDDLDLAKALAYVEARRAAISKLDS